MDGGASSADRFEVSERMSAPLPPAAPAAGRPAPGFLLGLLASFFFSVSIGFSNGAYSEPALLYVTLGFAVLMLGFVLQLLRRPLSQRASLWLTSGLVLLGLLAMCLLGWTDPNLLLMPQTDWATGRQMLLTNLLLTLSYLPFTLLGRPEPGWLRHGRFGLFALLLLVAGFDTVHSSPRPWIDVWEVQQEGAKALVQGLNPYEVVNVQDTGGRATLDVPYVYAPLQLFATVPAWVLGGDVRYAMITALLLTGFALRFIAQRGGRGMPALLEDAPALFLWLSPKLFFIVQQSWVDPVQLMWITLATTAHVLRRPLLQAVLFGLAFGSKQTMFWLVPLAGVLLRFSKRQWVISLAVAAATVLPFALLNFGALHHATFGLLSSLPPRPDALTFTNGLSYLLGFDIPYVVAFPAAAAVVALALSRLRGSLVGFAVALAATYATFFVFNKWAFANYYFLLSGLCCLWAATTCHARLPERSTAPVTPER
jgi:hypothetical protein